MWLDREVGLMRVLKVILRNLDFMLRVVESYWNILRKRVI